MKIKTLLFLFIGFLGYTGYQPFYENKDELPFAFNYSLPLRMISREHFEKYDYSEYVSGEDILQVKHYHNITKEKAKKIIEDRRFFILAMFKDQPNPYPGVLSNSIGCPKELQPKPNEDTIAIRLSFKLFATSNLIYGNCNINDNYFYCIYLMFFCPIENDFFELKVYTPIKKASFSYDEILTSVQCK